MNLTAGRRAALAVGAAASAAYLALWLTHGDKTFVFDGVMFAGVVERTTAEWRQELLNPRHFLFNPFFQVLRDALLKCGVPVGGYRLIQIVNALAGAAGLWAFAATLRRIVEDDLLAALGAILLGATWTFGTRATEGQVYMLLALGGLCTLWAAARLLEAPSTGRALVLTGALAAATLFHAAAAFLAPAVLAALLLAFPRDRRKVVAALAFGAAALLIPYRLRFGGDGLQGFTSGATDYRMADARGYWTGLVLKFWHNGGLTPAGRVLLSWTETGRAFLAIPEKAGAAVGLALWLAVGGALAAAWRSLDGRRRALAAVLFLAWAGFLFLNAFWVGGLFFAPIPAAALLGLAAAAASPRLRGLTAKGRNQLVGALAAAALALAAWNAREGLVPQSRIESNQAYSQALFIRDNTVPSSFIVIAGLVNSNLKVYIPNFAGRARDVLEYYFLSRPKDEALKLIAYFVSRQAEHGVPLYLLGEVIDDARVQAQMRALWGVTPEDIRAAFGPGKLIGIARRPDASIYLFVPQSRQPELFCGLAYSILTEGDVNRLKESVFAAKEIAREMTPAERAKTRALLKSSDWGFHLLRAGFEPQMNAQMRADADVRRARFLEFQKTADFWLRAGNLYKFLGLRAETIDAWTRAWRISGDASLLREIEALKKG